jgi:hypothetical protein
MVQKQVAVEEPQDKALHPSGRLSVTASLYHHISFPSSLLSHSLLGRGSGRANGTHEEGALANVAVRAAACRCWKAITT